MSESVSKAEAGGTFACPQCRAPVQMTDAICPVCGVDLVLAATLAERAVLTGIPAAADGPVAADVLLPRFGEYLVKNGFIGEPTLQLALGRQRQAAAAGQAPTIGQVLLAMGAVRREQLDVASLQQVKELQAALQASVADCRDSLRQALRRLGELNDLKANFVANISHELRTMQNISHELRTPVQEIRGVHDLLAEGAYGPLTDEQRAALAIGAGATTSLAHLIEDLIAFASMARGELAINCAPTPLPALVERALSDSRVKAAQHGVRLLAAVPAALPPAHADARHLTWVLMQLLDNAIKFTPAGGEVLVRAAPAAGGLRLAVQDTGIGIAPDQLDAVFTPFHQIDNSATRQYGGTGLGLAMVRRIVAAHGSAVEIETAPGAGSTFAFTLPAAAPA